MKYQEIVSAILFRKWVSKECPFRCEGCQFLKECAWGAVIAGSARVKIVLRVID